MSNSQDHILPGSKSMTSHLHAAGNKRDLHYRAVAAPQAYQGIGWALTRAYPTAGRALPEEMVAMLEKLDAKTGGSGEAR